MSKEEIIFMLKQEIVEYKNKSQTAEKVLDKDFAYAQYKALEKFLEKID